LFFEKIFLVEHFTTQMVCDDVQVTAETNDDELLCGSGHGSHLQQIN
jgi:hypothetical protein